MRGTAGNAAAPRGQLQECAAGKFHDASSTVRYVADLQSIWTPCGNRLHLSC